ncbi:hypothetical protein [Nostoc sp. C057]|nr:hypothetical protein [Nostoc sp. C057]
MSKYSAGYAYTKERLSSKQGKSLLLRSHMREEGFSKSPKY